MSDDPVDSRPITPAELFATVGERDQPRASSSTIGSTGGVPGDLGARYRLGQPLGSGTTGQVWTAQDLALDRSIALKVLGTVGGPAMARFIREARITAGIDHPNVVTIHDLAFGSNGAAFFTMRRIQGRSLGDLLRAMTAGEPAPEIADLNQRITILLKVSDALARAHDLGIVHRDIKPDNIMVGSYGEVAVVDWGEARHLEGDGDPSGQRATVSGETVPELPAITSATAAGAKPGQAAKTAVGTPIYMSPEQAEGEIADIRCDVWSLGATLWHVLTLQPPWTHPDPVAFWEGKRRGMTTPLPPAAARVPRQLLAIARKAMEVAPRERYQAVAAFAQDLARFQAGQSVEALHENRLIRFSRWVRRHAQGVMVGALVTAALAGSLGLWWQERERQAAGWGRPSVVEEFADDTWHQRWLEPEPGMWKVEDGRLISTAETAAHLVLHRRFNGSVAVEFEGEILPGSTPCDLSVWWNETDSPMESPSDWSKPFLRQLRLQAGAYNNSFCGLFSGDSRLAMVRRTLETGRRYRFRFEFDDHDVRLIVDGETWIEHHDLLAMGNGYISLYGFYPGKAFAHIAVYEKRQAELVPAVAVGDELMRERRLAKAAISYGQVADSLPGTDIGAEARYKQAGALWAMGNAKAARRVWSQIPPGPWADLARCDRLDEPFRLGQVEEACTQLVRLYAELPRCRAHLRLLWEQWAALPITSRRQGNASNDVALLEAKARAFPDDAASDWRAADLSLELYGPLATLHRFPNELLKVQELQLLLGRYRAVVDRPGPIWQRSRALIMLGRVDEALAYIANAQERAYLLGLAGRGNDALLQMPDEPFSYLMTGDPFQALTLSTTEHQTRSIALVHLGRYEEAVIEERALQDSLTPRKGFAPGLVAVLLAAGRISEAEAESGYTRVPPLIFALGHRFAGDPAGEARIRAEIRRANPDWDWSTPDIWLDRRVLEPLLTGIDGDAKPLRDLLGELAEVPAEPMAGRPRLLARYALGLAGPAEFDHLVFPSERTAWLTLGDALRAELAGDAPTITAAWAAWLALAPHQRLTGNVLPNPTIDLIARWRSGRLVPGSLR